MNIVASALGHYPYTRNTEEADVVFGHSLGTSIDAGSPNQVLAHLLLESAGGRPVVADRTLVEAFPANRPQPDFIVEGETSNALGQGVGTWGTLLAGKEFMEKFGLNTALQIGGANHIGRILMQARRLGIDSVAPENLPAIFDRKADAKQFYTRSLALWVPHEVIGSVVLRLQHKL